jgi:hypothetical protein
MLVCACASSGHSLSRAPRGPFEDACSGIEHVEVLERWGSLQRSSCETTNAIHPSARPRTSVRPHAPGSALAAAWSCANAPDPDPDP